MSRVNQDVRPRPAAFEHGPLKQIVRPTSPSRLSAVRRAAWILLAVAVLGVVAIGLSQAGGKSIPAERQPRFDLTAALDSLRGAPAPLAALHGQSAQLLDGGVPAVRARLKELRGHPVVINKWGSWCGPCRTEFPVFQRVSAKRGGEVAFLGIDGHDPRDEAQAFLRDYPVPYPSYVDRDEKIARDLGIPKNYPITLFIDERGREAFVHQGEYTSDRELEADIDRYLGAGA